MSNTEIIFRNSKDIIQNGKDNDCKGLLYCGKKYTSNGGCPCLSCDGICGMDNGCPCPDCDYTLSFILYSTGEMNCPICKSMLLRLKIFNIKILNGFSKDYPISIRCNICMKEYYKNFLPIMLCKKCNYKICPNCAFKKISLDNINDLRNIKLNSTEDGMVYCGKQYTYLYMCVCGTCNGICGLYNGCPCPICDIILGYNIYLNNMICKKCSNTLLVKTNLILLQKYEKNENSGFTCDICGRLFLQKYNLTFRCFKCNFDLCQICAFNFIKNKNILYPNLPQKINKDNNKENDKKDSDDENDTLKCVICLENNKSYLFMPCKHVCCCENCSKNLKECPICRNKIESSFKIYI